MNVENTAHPGTTPAVESANASDAAARVLSTDSLRAAVWVAAALIAWWSIARSTFAFDKEVTLYTYPDVADGFGVWAWIAAIVHGFGMSAESFYAVVSLPFAVAYVHLVRSLSGRSALLAIAFAVLFLSWFGYGQLRYGTALALLVIAIEQLKSHRLVAVGALVAAVLIHPAACLGLLVLAAWWALVRRGSMLHALALIACGYVALVLADSATLAAAVLSVSGYEHYVNWLDLDAPNTIFKYAYLVLVLGASSAAGNRALQKELALVFLLLPTALMPPFAGRGYLFLVSVLVGRLCALPASEMPSRLVTAALAAALFAETALLWTSDLYSF